MKIPKKYSFKVKKKIKKIIFLKMLLICKNKQAACFIYFFYNIIYDP